MARTVNPEQHAMRRLHIIDAALTRFAADGYDGASTASVCREAGIGSGTFFHYFPTKADLLVAILELGTQETRDWFAARTTDDSAVAVLRDWAAYSASELTDPRVAGFVRAVGAVMTQPAFAAALAADEEAQRTGLLPWVEQAQADGQVRTDLGAGRLTSWVMLLLDGFVGRIATEDSFSPTEETGMLLDALDRLLAP